MRPPPVETIKAAVTQAEMTAVSVPVLEGAEVDANFKVCSGTISQAACLSQSAADHGTAEFSQTVAEIIKLLQCHSCGPAKLHVLVQSLTPAGARCSIVSNLQQPFATHLGSQAEEGK